MSTFRLKYDEWLFAAIIGLALFGVVMVYSASAFLAIHESGNQFAYFAKQAVSLLIGLAAMLLAMRVDYRVWRNSKIVYGLLALVLVMLLAVFAFPSINGARRWIRLPGLSIQPSELAKIALLLFLARFLERRAGEEHLFFRTLAPAVSVTGFLIILIVGEPDLGTAMMLGVICLALLFAAGARLAHIGVPLAAGAVGAVLMIVLFPWRMRRVLSFLDPWQDAQGAGYQVVQSLISVGSGGITGLGFAQGKQKMLFLPFAHSDFIFAVIGEELGLIGSLMIVLTFGVVLWRGITVSLAAPERFGKLLGLGIVIMIVAQAMLNMSVVLALVPTKGIPLPFISSGGSSLVPTLFAMGILLNISQHALPALETNALETNANALRRRVYKSGVAR